jgi:hypothetical protein
MVIPSVPEEQVLFDIAWGTRDACRRVYAGNPEDVIKLLGAAAFQLQAAWVGSRMAAMANDAEYTPILRTVATDYGGVSVAALNLSVRCSVTAVDLCGSALGRLTGLNTNVNHESDAKDVRCRCKPSNLSDQRLAPLATEYLQSVSRQEWLDTEALRHKVTHRHYKRGVYAYAGRRPDPAPLALPRQLDIEHRSWGMHPLDQMAVRVTRQAEATFRRFCDTLAALATPGL